MLPGAIERVRKKLTGDDGDRQMVKVLTDGLTAVDAACAEALDAGIANSDVILNALARRQQSQPSPSIAAPERLTLETPPIADCARYDAIRTAPITAIPIACDAPGLGAAEHAQRGTWGGLP